MPSSVDAIQDVQKHCEKIDDGQGLSWRDDLPKFPAFLWELKVRVRIN
jgi:hypothetical protein